MTLHPITLDYRTTGEDRNQDSRDDAGVLYAGGTDIIPLARSGVLHTPDLVDIKGSDLSSDIDVDGGWWTVGALVTLSELERHGEIAAEIPAIAQALSQVATRQIRNRATVGGNLLQRPRCSYFRDADVSCRMKGGSTCPAIDGRNEHLALGGDFCVAPQPSDLAGVLVALGAELSISAGGATRRIAVADFLVAPTSEHPSLHDARDGDVVTAIHVPRPTGRSASVYLKAMDRAVWQFALVGVAVVVGFGDDGQVESARLVASGVANTPLVLTEAAAGLVGGDLSDSAIERAATVATQGLGSLSENGYKLALVRGLVTRSLESVVALSSV